MRINPGKCVGCGQCRVFCPMGCIAFTRKDKGGQIQCRINEDECVDCEVCLRANACPTDALEQPPAAWPRSVRGTFSNPLITHKETKVPGRGTEEIKTNDVTNRYKCGYVGISAELGRPVLGARLRDAERVFMVLAPLAVEFEKQNPLTSLLADPATGKLKEDVLGEKVLSCIVETIAPIERAAEILDALDKVAGEIESVFSVDLISRVEEDLSIPALEMLKREKRSYALNGKINIGLGRLCIKGADC
ncbi:MAG: ferredoxin family protein [Acidaminococcales bacterium]|nr:ferredoxin family protein [Acidaminococcales bacterium]